MEDKSIKKTIKIVLVILAVSMLIPVTGYLVLQSRTVQTWLTSTIVNAFSENLGMKISIKKVDISLFNKLVLDDVYLSDKNNDTLASFSKVVASVDSFSYKNKKIYLGKTKLVDPKLNVIKEESGKLNFSIFDTKLTDSPDSTSKFWQIFCQNFAISGGILKYTDNSKKDELFTNFQLTRFNSEITDFKLLSIDSISLNLSKLDFIGTYGFELHTFEAGIKYEGQKLTVSNLNASTQKSELKVNQLDIDFNEFIKENKLENIKFALDLTKLHLGLSDISFAIPDFNQSSITTDISGKISGTIADLKGKKIEARLGELTYVSGEFYLNGLPDIAQTYMFVDLFDSHINLNDIRNLDLPFDMRKIVDNLPKELDNIGTASYKGNFTGFLNDFVTYGTLSSDIGSIKSDLSIKPLGTKSIKIDGHISAADFNVGALFVNSDIGKLSLSGKVKGSFKDEKEYSLSFDGNVESIDANNYHFQNIQLNGNIKPKRFEGDLSINDPNISLDYSGSLDLSSEIPVFEFITSVKNANLSMLNLYSDSIATLSFNLNANFKGKNIDDFMGAIAIRDFDFKNVNNELQLTSINLNTKTQNDTGLIVLKSDLIDAEIKGKYSLMNIGKSVSNLVSSYLKSKSTKPDSVMYDTNNFTFTFNCKNIESICNLVEPGLLIKAPFTLSGYYNPSNKKTFIEGLIPRISYQNVNATKLAIKAGSDNNNIYCRLKCDSLNVNNNLRFYNLTADSYGAHDSLAVNFFWNNFDDKTYSGAVKTITNISLNDSKFPHLDVHVLPSKIYFADSLLTINDSHIFIDSSTIKINALSFQNNEQKLHIDGVISKKHDAELKVSANNVNLSVFEPIMPEDLKIAGVFNGDARLKDLYDSKRIDLNVVIEKFAYMDKLLGNLKLTSNWNENQQKIISSIIIENEQNNLLNVSGSYDPKNDIIDFDSKVNRAPVTLLTLFLPDALGNYGGFVSGGLKISGKSDNVLLTGQLKPDGEIAIGVLYLKSIYYFKDPVNFEGNKISFPNMRFRDVYNNTGVFSGYLKHENFSNMVYDMNVTTDKILVFNTTSKDNDYFYGTGYGSGKLRISGKGGDVLLSGSVKTQKGTQLYIPLETTDDMVDQNFIKFVSHSDTEAKQEIKYEISTGGVEMNFDIEATPDAKIQLIFNSRNGEVMSGEGSGNIQVHLDNNYNMQLFGDYSIDKGDYLFSLQNIYKQNFTFERGGTLKWSGDPYNAKIDIRAVYNVKAPLKELLLNSYSDIDLSRRIPVNCIIHLTDNLIQPNINFEIELPTAEDRIKDEVKQYLTTEEDVNKQIISLILLKRFFTPEYLSNSNTPANNTGSELVGSTASDILSSTLSGWLSKVSKNVDVGVKYRPGNQITKEEVELAMSYQILDDRLTINTNVGNNTNTSTTNKNADIIGDFDVNWKIKNGKLRFKAYTHANDNLIYDTAPYTQGIGISYRQDFNSLKELIEFYAKALKRRNKSSSSDAKTK